jgi:hypothetical protein
MPEEREAWEIAQRATKGPWKWTGEYGDAESGHQGPDLVTVDGAFYSCPHYCRWKDDSGVIRQGKGPQEPHEHFAVDAVILESWGYDADGVEISDEDKTFIAHANPAWVLGMLERLAAYRKALRFYADEENYESIPTAMMDSEITMDGGEIARAALGEEE